MRWLPIVVFAIVGCSVETDFSDPRVLQGTLSIDSSFSEEQQAQVLAAVDFWTEATQGVFSPNLVVEPVECGQPFAIEAVAQAGCRVGHLPEGEEAGSDLRVLGAANRFRHTVTVVSWLEGEAFRNNVAHELGHYLMMGHGDGIMAQQRHGQKPVVTESNLAEFCRHWPCGDLVFDAHPFDRKRDEARNVQEPNEAR